MIDVKCYRCGYSLHSPGGLLFSPPYPGTDFSCAKYHLCVRCFDKVMDWLEDEKNKKVNRK